MQLIMAENPHCIITHGARASHLLKSTRTTVPIIAVSHKTMGFKHLFGSDALIALTKEMRGDIIKAGQNPKKVFMVPNMIHMPNGLNFSEPKNSAIPVIGVCGRFEKVKGFDIFLLALSELKKRGIPFKAKIAGEGPEIDTYNEIIQMHGIKDDVEFIGWVNDKKQFYESLDIFCLPSHSESFGLVILEAFMHSLPCVLTNSSGPNEIVGDSGCAILVPPSSPLALAEGLMKILANRELYSSLALASFQRVQYYSSLNISRMIQRVIEEVCYAKLNPQY